MRVEGVRGCGGVKRWIVGEKGLGLSVSTTHPVHGTLVKHHSEED